MFRIIFEKEIRDIIGSTKFAVTFGACALLIIAAFYAGAARYQLQRSHYEASVAANLAELNGVTDWATVGETSIFMPPRPLASLVSGVSNDIGRSAVVRGRGEVIPQGSHYNENLIYAVFRYLDLEFVFQVILSLFAILLGYDAISGEKERGTLRLSFANAIPRHTYILGKAAGSTMILALSLLCAVALGCLLLPLMGIVLSGDEWLRLGLITFTGLLYFVAFLTLSLWVSAMTKRSANSFLALLVIWIMSVMVVPRVAVLLAGRAVDVPSADSIASQKGQFATQLHQEFLDGLSGFSIPLAEAGSDPGRALMSFMDSLSNVRESKMHQFASRLNETRQNRRLKQHQVSFALARISPTASMTLATSRLAGTSLELENRFYEQAGAFQTEFGNFKTEKVGMNAGGVMRVISIEDGANPPPPPEPVDADELPAFHFQDVTSSEAIEASAADIGLLAIFALAFFGGAVFSFNRYDVR